ncbi:MAG: hypothetical protein M3O70_01135 [Actinomycetota bacterium]|nr:hypothetical protein [Actinomycetota bacterium]
MAASHELRDQTAARRPDEDRTSDANCVHEAHDVVGEVLGPVTVRRALGIAVAALTRRIAVERRREMLEDGRQVPPGLDVGVHEHDRGANGVTCLRVGDEESARQGDGLDGDVGHADSPSPLPQRKLNRKRSRYCEILTGLDILQRTQFRRV